MSTTIFLDPDGPEAGRIGEHTRPAVFSIAAAPSTSTDTNTFRLRLLVVACWRMDDARFAFDSSFIVPSARKELALLRQVVAAHRGSPLSIFGHADPTGDDNYNKQLSGRRARAVFALLTRQAKIWEQLFSQPMLGDAWGIRSVQVMLEALGSTPVETDGRLGPQTRDAVRRFQETSAAALAVDGEPGPATREKLFEKYMDFLCKAEGSDETIRLSKSDFVGGGIDDDGKGDYQGCSEFNPVLVFSRDENTGFQQPDQKEKRNSENLPNRRVTAYLFRKGLQLSPAKWPCPRWNEGVAGCRAQFFSDGERRRGPQATRRLYEDTEDTFACAFYDQLSNRSPCEGSGRLLVFRLRLLNAQRDPIAEAVCRVIQGTSNIRGEADPAGFVTIIARERPAKLRVEWTTRERATEPTFPFSLEVFVAPDDGEDGAFQRLHNLGYSSEPTLRERVVAFQRDFGRAETGDFKDIEGELNNWHDGGNKPAVSSA